MLRYLSELDVSELKNDVIWSTSFVNACTGPGASLTIKDSSRVTTSLVSSS